MRTILASCPGAAVFCCTFAIAAAAQDSPPHEKNTSLQPLPKSVIFSAVFSPDGKTLALASEDKSISLYDWKTGQRLSHLKGHKERVWIAKFSPDARWLASCDGEYFRPNDPGEVRIWNVKGGKEQFVLTGHRSLVFDVEFSADGKTLYSGDWNGIVKEWDLKTGKERKSLQLYKQAVRNIVLSPNGEMLAIGSFDGHIGLHDSGTLERIRTWRAHPRGVQSLDFTADGQFLASCERPPPGSEKPDGIRIWSVATGKQSGLLTGAKTVVLSVKFSRDGQMLASSGGAFSSYGEIRLFEIASGRPRANFPKTKEWMECVCFSPDGRSLLSVGGFTRGKPGIIFHRRLLDLAGPQKSILAFSQLEQSNLWDALASNKADEAYAAMLTLISSPEPAVKLLAGHLRPVKPATQKEIKQWIRDLDSEKFRVRARATARLKKIKEQARPHLYQLLAKSPSAESAERAFKLLEPIELPLNDTELLRQIRAVEVLERIGSPVAQSLLQRLAKGAPPAYMTEHARASLQRLAGR